MLKHLFAGTKWDVPCERCGKVLSTCSCPPPPEKTGTKEAQRASPESQKATIRLEKRPGGKKVTLVQGLERKDREELLPRLKSLCGAGGTEKDGVLEIQGDQK